MNKAILGTKVGMTQIFDENGKVIPVTIVLAGPCTVVQKKTVETDGYDAVKVGFGEVKEKSTQIYQKGVEKAGEAVNRIKKGPGEFDFSECFDENEADTEIKAEDEETVVAESADDTCACGCACEAEESEAEVKEAAADEDCAEDTCGCCCGTEEAEEEKQTKIRRK